jgi:type IV secretory pathway TrbD component
MSAGPSGGEATAQGWGPEPQRLTRRSPAMLAAVIYTGLSIAAGLVFLAVTIAFGDYSWVARIGGAVWVFALCMIILMPTVTPLVRERMKNQGEGLPRPRTKEAQDAPQDR